MEKWEDGFYITAIAGSTGGSSLVVMSKGTPYTQQSYKVCLPWLGVVAMTVYAGMSVLCPSRSMA